MARLENASDSSCLYIVHVKKISTKTLANCIWNLLTHLGIGVLFVTLRNFLSPLWQLEKYLVSIVWFTFVTCQNREKLQTRYLWEEAKLRKPLTGSVGESWEMGFQDEKNLVSHLFLCRNFVINSNVWAYEGWKKKGKFLWKW